MKLKLSAIMLAAISLCAAATAQVDNCCNVNRQCNNDADWTQGYYDFQNGQCAAPAPSGATTQTSASSQIDNCCFAGWQCNNDQDWVNGYHAYQNGQCAAPAPTQSGSPAQTSASSQTDNCCQAGWQCNSEQDWSNGYYAYRENQCHKTPEVYGAYSCCELGWNCGFDFDFIHAWWWYEHHDGQCSQPLQEIVDGVIIEGSAEFIAQHKAAMQMLKNRAPEWHAYTIAIILKIRESREKPGYGTLHKSMNLPVWHSVAYAAAIIVHETCHVHRSYAYVHTHEYENIAEEPICDQVAIDSLQQFSPGTYYPRGRIDEYYRNGHTWDFGPSVQRELQRARDIYARTR
ncbi:MAG: hypothetical protein OXG85_08945 [Chloroflexi bacterium]|nr:hypothetical protein [Chloroflexota bacterium]